MFHCLQHGVMVKDRVGVRVRITVRIRVRIRVSSSACDAG